MLTKEMVPDLWSKNTTPIGNQIGHTFFPFMIMIFTSGIPSRKYEKTWRARGTEKEEE